MAEIKTLIIRLYQGISNCGDQSSTAAMQDTIEAQARTIQHIETDMKARNERIETLLILKDVYYNGMHAWRTSAEDGIPITDELARRKFGSTVLEGML